MDEVEFLRDTCENSANMPDLSTFHITHCSPALCLCSGTSIDHNCTTAMHLTTNLQHMRWMLENGADIEAENVQGQRPIHYAVYMRLVEMVELLIQHGANVDAADVDGNTPLHYAARYGLDIVLLLVQHGAKVNVQNNKGETPLHDAVKYSYEHSDVIMFLLKEGADTALTDNWRNTPLHYLTIEQLTNDGLADCIISHSKKYLHCQHLLIRNAFSITALSHMVAHGILDYLNDTNHCRKQTLVAEPVYIDCNGNTPLHHAVGVYKQLKMTTVSTNVTNSVEFLLKRGADLNAKNKEGLTPLHVACDEEAINACLQHPNNQSFTAVDKRGRNFWHLLFLSPVQHSSVKLASTIRPMISASDSKYDVDDLCRTPLHYACMNSNSCGRVHLKFIDKFNEQLIDMRDKFGRTALHYAAMKNNIPLTELLRNKKADDTLRDNFEKSASEYRNRGPCRLMPVSRSQLQDVSTYLVDDFQSVLVCVHQCFFEQTRIAERSKAKLRDHINKIGISNVLSIFHGCRVDYSHVVCDKTMSVMKDVRERLLDRMQSDTLVNSCALDAPTNGDVSAASVQTSALKCKVYDREDADTNDNASATQPPTMYAAIQSEVHKAMKYLAKQISAQDARFACEVVPVGSAYEGTKIGFCDEFDYDFVLTNLSRSCNVCYSPESPSGFVRVKGITPPYDEELFNDNGILNARIVKLKFETLVKQVLSSNTFCVNTGFEFFDPVEDPFTLILRKITPTSAKVNMHIELAFTTPVNGCHVPHNVSVDVVPTLRVDDWWPEDSRKKELCQSGECLIVLTQPQNKYPWIGWTEPHGFISFAPAESRLLRNCPAVIKAAYIVVKCMSEYFFPRQHEFFSSHVIKTALFWCLDEDCSNNDHKSSDFDNDEVSKDELLRWVQKILRRLLRFAAQDYVPSYFMPKCHQPVWVYEKYLKHFHTYLYQRGLTYKDVCSLNDEVGMLDNIKEMFVFSHVMYWSVLADTDELELFVPSTINPLTEDDVCVTLLPVH